LRNSRVTPAEKMVAIHPKKKPKVVVVGGYNADLLVTCSQLPTAARIFMGGPLQIFGGGRGANIAVAAARAGCEVTFVGACGRDGFGGMARGLLTNEAINLDYFTEVPHCNTGTSLILTESATGRNMTMVAESANSMVTTEMVHQARSEIKSADLVFSELEIRTETAWATMRMCEEFGVPFVLDASPCQRAVIVPSNHMLAIVLTEAELVSVAGTPDLEKSITELHGTGCQNVVVVHGNEHVIYSDGTSSLETPIPAVRLVDRCGAVECLGAWIGLGLIRKLPVADVCRTAAAAMAFSLGHLGGQRSMPTESDISEILSHDHSAARSAAL
jgi:ribokinase